MVFKLLVGGNDGDLKNVADQGGYFRDTVYVAYEADFHIYSIFTYRNDDLIDLRDANEMNFNSVYAGAGNDVVLGGAGNDLIVDQSGNDRILLGRGNGTVYAGRGNDRIDGGLGGDKLIFGLQVDDNGQPVFNRVGITCDLQITTAQKLGPFGTDVLSGFEAIEGGDGNDRFFGSATRNELIGSAGNDVLRGRGGTDALYGGFGRDILIGDGGGDLLDCSLADDARDFVRYFKMSDSGVGSSPGVVDSISKFDAGSTRTDDRIDLSAIDARPGTGADDAFIFRGTGSFRSGGGEVRLQVIGPDTLVHVDIDGDGASEMNILVLDVTGLTVGDFIL